VRDCTTIDLYVDSDATPDAELWLRGGQSSLTVGNFILGGSAVGSACFAI